MIIRNSKGNGVRMSRKINGKRGKIILMKRGICIQADNNILCPGNFADGVHDSFPCPADTMFPSFPTVPGRAPVNDLYLNPLILLQELQGLRICLT